MWERQEGKRGYKAVPSEYCRLGNFCKKFIFANSIKRHISDVKNLRLMQDLPISVNDRVILPFCEGFIFTKLHENKVLGKISEFTVAILLQVPEESGAHSVTVTGR